MQKRELKITKDGSHTLFVPEINECYHSTHGAVQESKHVFIQEGFALCAKDAINILEIGFGTGLNAFLTALPPHEEEILAQKINYFAIELYPISLEQVLKLNYPEILNNQQVLFRKIHSSEWNKPVKISENFTLHKIQADFTKINFLQIFPHTQFDVIYFDAFSPEKQPEMWSEEMFKKLYLCASENAVMTTYCSKGTVRRAMESVGFSVEKLPGPPGKREILRARKVDF